MSIGPASSVVGEFLADQFDGGLDALNSVWVCAIHKGSFWIDKVRVVYVLKRTRTGTDFGQVKYEKDVYFLTQPTCDRPETIALD